MLQHTCWFVLQSAARSFNSLGTAMSQSYVLCHRMLHFLQTFEHYMTFEVCSWACFLACHCLVSIASMPPLGEEHSSFLCLVWCLSRALLWPENWDKNAKKEPYKPCKEGFAHLGPSLMWCVVVLSCSVVSELLYLWISFWCVDTLWCGCKQRTRLWRELDE